MASYTIEDIELIRKKSGISYQEAVALLDYHNGNVARALVDLERNGRIKPEAERERARESRNDHRRRKGGLSSLLSRLYQFRLKVHKGNVAILNISLLFTLLAAIVSPHLLILTVILVLILGYHVSFDKQDKDFASANLEKMVRNATENVKTTVNDFTSSLKEDAQEAAEEKTDATGDAAQHDSRSYYQSNPAATTYHTTYTGSAPTLQVPVQVESQDGSVRVEPDKDGYNSATIE